MSPSVAAAIVASVSWNDVYSFFGNLCSIVGLAITVWVLVRQGKLEKVIDATLQAISQAMLRADAERLNSQIEALRECCRRNQVERAIDRCTEAKHLATRLAGHALLEENEQASIAAGSNDLRLFLNFLESITASPTTSESLEQEESGAQPDGPEGEEGPEGRKDSGPITILTTHRQNALNRLSTAIGTILGRLQNTLFERSHVS